MHTDHDVSAHSENSSWLSRRFSLPKEEVKLFAWSSIYFFLLLFSYYFINPLRGAYVATPWAQKHLLLLFTTTAILVLALNPVYNFIVSKYPRQRFIPGASLLFALGFILFFVLLRFVQEPFVEDISLAFSIWVSIFNLFAISIFWDLMVDVYTPEQGQRLFGIIGIVGNIGALLASIGAEVWIKLHPNPMYLILPTIVALILTVPCIQRIHTMSSGLHVNTKVFLSEQTPPGTGAFSFLRTVFRSKYLLGICAYTLIAVLSGTLLYTKQASQLSAQRMSISSAASYFSRETILTEIVIILLQCLLAGRLLRKLGVKVTLALLPMFILVGFMLKPLFGTITTYTILSYSPAIFFIMVLRIFSKALEFSLIKPARKVLFTIVTRDEKYCAQSFIDTFIYRGADVLLVSLQKLVDSSSWFAPIGLGLLLMPIWVAWIFLSLFLGRRYEQARDTEPST